MGIIGVTDNSQDFLMLKVNNINSKRGFIKQNGRYINRPGKSLK
ncbi:hypothetical protein C900_00835 [Fulvivirga imtechensis AK7]|uniref:Uncharacterized protein n=1 Tax=Fulvivirga imtechensis AK7 TaxID=1237149 RepID=L8JZ05_9BACT|nr:hypothetical protein C900_00835 [Fulvivirga imtechensis AK7]